MCCVSFIQSGHVLVSVISRPLRCDCRSCAGTVNLYMCVLASLVAIRRDVFNVCGDPPCRAPRAPILQTPKFVNVSANRRPKKGKRARTNKMLAAVATLLLAVPSLPDAEQQPLLPPPASSSSVRSSQASSPRPPLPVHSLRACAHLSRPFGPRPYPQLYANESTFLAYAATPVAARWRAFNASSGFASPPVFSIGSPAGPWGLTPLES